MLPTRLLSALGALWLAAAPVARAGQPVRAEIGGGWGQADTMPRTLIPFPGDVVAMPDITYASIPGYRPLKLDLYQQKGAKDRPLVVFIHGGGWSRGTPRLLAGFKDLPAILADLASRGYVVAAVSYRLSAEAPFPAQAQDVDMAIRWLRTHAADYGIDKGRVAVRGDSAGAHLAAMAATDCDPTAAGESDCVQAAVP